MTTAQFVETSVTVNNNSPIQDYVHPDDQTQPTFEMTPGFKPFKIKTINVVQRDFQVIEGKKAGWCVSTSIIGSVGEATFWEMLWLFVLIAYLKGDV